MIPFKVIQPRVTRSQAYDFGFDCGLNGSNTTNCHFSIFSSPMNTAKWELGMADGEKTKAKP